MSSPKWITAGEPGSGKPKLLERTGDYTEYVIRAEFYGGSFPSLAHKVCDWLNLQEELDRAERETVEAKLIRKENMDTQETGFVND
jgi:hypothetical protein